MASYEADCEDLSGDESWETDTATTFLSNRPATTTTTTQPLYAFNDPMPHGQAPLLPPPMHAIEELETADDPAAYSDDSEYSLDYEYLGPRNPNYRPRDDADSDASELSDADLDMQQADNDRETAAATTATATTAGFDMWDEDPYSTNDYTWESNDMRLTWFIKARKTQLAQLDAMAPWHRTSFWRKEKGWPRQLPSSCSTTNHDQSANALCLVLGNYGLSEQLYAIYRNRILECGRPIIMDKRRQQHQHHYPSINRGGGGGRWMGEQRAKQDPLTWIDSDQRSSSSSSTSIRIQGSSTMDMDGKGNNNNNNNGSSSSSSSHQQQQPLPTTTTTTTTTTMTTSNHEGGSDDNSNSGTSSNGSKFCETHLSVSLRRSSTSDHPTYNHMLTSSSSSGDGNNNHDHASTGIISKFVPFTKYIRRADFPPVFRQDSYMALEFEPLCLAQKYGYMAIGGLEGEFELYCCHDQEHPPRKIWGTKFKSKNNVQLMTNSVQIVRLSRLDQPNVYDHMLIVCMNEAGVLLYRLPPHHDCLEQQHHHQQVVQLYTHLRSFDNVPINDAKVSFDQRQMVCVGDDRYVFLFDLVHDAATGSVVFTNQRKLVVPVHRLQGGGGGVGEHPAGEMPYSSQYVSWSQSSRHFAHTSDTHNHVLVWRAETQQVLYSIDAAGYTYAIAFHPRLEGVLAFTNRYGYLHTINLEEAILATTTSSSLHQHTQQQQVVNILDLDHTPPLSASSHHDNNNHQERLAAHQEITMIAFRGERDRRLRILAKINGIQWSRDGKYLYVATKKRVLAYEFLMTSRSVSSLVELTGDKVREIFERFDSATREQDNNNNKQRMNMTSRKRKRIDKKNISTRPSKDPKIRATAWFTKWSLVPPHLRHTVLKESNLASHW